jgi:hypothetical protein
MEHYANGITRITTGLVVLAIILLCFLGIYSYQKTLRSVTNENQMQTTVVGDAGSGSLVSVSNYSPQISMESVRSLQGVPNFTLPKDLPSGLNLTQIRGNQISSP